MDKAEQEKVELEDILHRLKQDGLDPGSTADEHLCHLWGLFQRCEGSLCSAMQDLEELRHQQASEMKEMHKSYVCNFTEDTGLKKMTKQVYKVENYVDHIRNLSEEREALTAEFERENEQFKIELQQLRLEQEAQVKEVEEMLDQEGLSEIAHSNPSEQIAYLLVERATLLEKLDIADRKLDSQSYTGSLREAQLQEELDQIHQTLEEELRQQRESMQRTKETMNKEMLPPTQNPWKKLFGLRKAADSVRGDASSHNDDLEKERKLRERVERDLDEAARRLQMAHEEIRRLTDELDVEKKTRCQNDPELQVARQEVELLREEVDKLKNSDLLELQKAKEHNVRLDKEILALRNRVRSLDSERKALVETVEKLKEEIQKHQEEKEQVDGTPITNEETEVKLKRQLQLPQIQQDQGQVTFLLTDALGTNPLQQEQKDEMLHKRCQQEVEGWECRNQELQRKLQKLQQEHEELIERNEELESILGETQNRTKEEKECFECEMDGLHRKIICLEAELSKTKKNKEFEVKHWELAATLTKEQELQQHLKSSQEKVEILEGRLTEETEWRKQLEADLNATQNALKHEREELSKSHVELDQLVKELKGLCAVASERDALVITAEKLKHEKSALEQKVSQMEKECGELRKDLVGKKSTNANIQETLSANLKRSSDLTAQIENLSGKIQNLEREKILLRNELSDSHAKLEFLQKEVNTSVKERQLFQGDNQRLKDEVLRTRQQLSNSQEELQRIKQDAAREQSQLLMQRGPIDKEESTQQLHSLKIELSRMQSAIEQERLHAAQQKLTLEAQTSEARSRVKSQESLLRQQTEEVQQFRQDLHRVQNLFSSAERELRYERDKNLDLKKHIALLQQENTKVNAEIKQILSKFSDQEQTSIGHRVELDRSQLKVKELEIEVAKLRQTTKLNKSLQEKLADERSRAIDADKKVLELQQQLNAAQHQLHLLETRVQEKELLEEEVREGKENVARLRGRLQEEQLQRKLLDQNVEDLQQQIKSLRGREASISQTNTELQLRLQQRETQLQVLENEQVTAADEHQYNQRTSQKLSVQLSSCQLETDRLQEELQLVLQQLDTHIRKYNEKQTRHKAKLRRAKEVFEQEIKLRDAKNKQLESEIAITKSLSEKEQAWIKKLTTENEQLLLEKRELLQQINEQEEVGRTNNRTISTVQHKMHFLEEENRQLQDRTLKLNSQVGTLERVVRNIQSVRSLEELRKIFPSECLLLNGSILSSSNTNFTTAGVCDTLGILEAIQRVKCAEPAESIKSSFSASRSQPSEIGYLNLTSPIAGGESQDQEEGPSLGSDEV
nr:PREDICTED: coiled-coil domain-containing protein 30 [Latimeria chalumnae]|eukprot:XP_005994059.1 PREDICTED: coiled-coil domain-containing protein 30 [Latimeria chalumnae]